MNKPTPNSVLIWSSLVTIGLSLAVLGKGHLLWIPIVFGAATLLALLNNLRINRNRRRRIV